jgi:hypothetical protein
MGVGTIVSRIRAGPAPVRVTVTNVDQAPLPQYDRGGRMKLRPSADKPGSEPNDGFAWSEIICESREAAQSEVQRQQERDSAEAEWIYLRNESGEWVARRTPRHLKPARKPLWKSLLEALMENLPP